MGFEHTPGPWFMSGGRLYGRDGYSLVCDSLVLHENWGTREHCANAALLTSAPELLEALKKARSFVYGPSSEKLLTEIDAVLAKAEGK